MTSTFIALYTPGPKWKPGISIRDQPPREHGLYLLGLYRAGSLKSAGPFRDESGAAIVIEARDRAVAEALIAHDPAVITGVFIAQVYEWDLIPWAKYLP